MARRRARARRFGLVRRARQPEERIPFEQPDLTVGPAIKAALIRGLVCAVFPALMMWPVVTGYLRGDSGYTLLAYDLAIVFGMLFICWMLHWFFAAWRKPNADNPRAVPIICLGRFVVTAGALVVIALAGELVGLITAEVGEDPGALLLHGVSSLTSSGMVVAVAIPYAIHALHSFWKRWVTTMEPTEALWWMDAVERMVCVVAYAISAVLIMAASLLWVPLWGLVRFVPFIDASSIPGFVEGTWPSVGIAMLQQTAASGVLTVVVVMLIVRTLWSRVKLWLDVRADWGQKQHQAREEARKAAGDSQLPTPYVPELRDALIRNVGGICVVVAYLVLAVALALAVIALTAQGAVGVTWSMLWGYVWSALLTTSPITPFASVPLAVVLAVIVGGCDALERHWYEAGGLKHGFIHGCVRLCVYAGYLAAVAAMGAAVVSAQMQTGFIGVLTQCFQAGLASVGAWASIVRFLASFIFAVLIICLIVVVGGFFLLALLGGAGEEAASGAGAGGGGGYTSSFGSSSSSKRQTVNDRYGRKLVEIDDSSLFGQTVVRDRHGNKVGTVRDGWDGATHVQVGDEEYRVRDATFSNDKIIEKDGKEVGRVRESSWGDDRLYRH